ncbi:MAG: glutathione S-transferase family protein [Alphaproteobacteria bacterium]
MSKPKLYALAYSPTSQRVFGTLAHKGVDYDMVEVDITKKERPAEFNAVSPFGKVPVLVHDGSNIVESSVICEYIDEVWPDPPMMPSDPARRAYARRWILFSNRVITDRDGEFVHVERDKDTKTAICRKIYPDLAILDRELEGNTSLFLGDDLSLVDVAFAPFARILGMWSELIGDTRYGEYRNLHAYFDRLGNHPTLAKAVYIIPDDVFRGFFHSVLVDGVTVP